MTRSRPSQFRLLTFFFVLASFILPGPARVRAYTPKSPEVVAMLKIAVPKLAGPNTTLPLGGECLVALALLKAEGDKSHPKVVAAIHKCRKACEADIGPDEIDNYSLGIALIYLCEFGPYKYRKEIDQLLKEMISRQKENGGWGYPLRQTGDTSQTQYAVLCLWSAQSIGVDVPTEVVVDVLDWLIRTQGISGAWGYQGVDPGIGNYNRVRQLRHTKSLSAAGLSSVYVCRDTLGLSSPVQQEEDSDLPPALKPVEDTAKIKRRTGLRLMAGKIRRTTSDGNKWFQENYEIDQDQWGHYYRYALERYQSFRELAEGRSDPDPSWYNDGVEFLKEKQDPSGYWASSEMDKSVATAFAVLFLTRSTKQSIEKSLEGKGTVRGGRGLPRDTNNVRMIDGRVVGPTLARSMKEIMAILEGSSESDLKELLEFPEQVAVNGSQEIVDEDVARLRGLVAGESYQVRLIAVRTLVKARDLNFVPILIYALTDPDPRVVREARDGLRFISRKFNGFGLPDTPKAAELQIGINEWKRWYLAIHPDANFLD